MKKIIFVIFPILVTIFIFHYFLVGQAVYGDGIYYWSYVRSVYIDQDLKLNDEINHHYDFLHNNSNLPDLIPKEDVKTIANEYHLPFGPSIGWLPFFALGDILARIFHLLNNSIVLNGYSDIYQITVGIGNIIYVLLGVYFIFKLLQKYFDTNIAIFTSIIIFFTTNLFYYSSLDVLNSHPFAFFVSSFLIYYFLIQLSSKWYLWLFLGILIGLLILTRTQELVFVLLIIAGFIKYKNLKLVFFSLFGLFISIFPQLLLYQIAYHGLFNSPYFLSEGFNVFKPQLLGILFNAKTGLVFTSPIVLVGLIGLFLLAKQKKYIGILALIIFSVEYYVIASWGAWDQAASYGIRMLITTYPLIAVGLGYIIEKLSRKISSKLLYLIGIFLFIFNLSMIVHFHLSVKTVTVDVTTVTRLEAQKRLNQLLHTNFKLFKE